MEFENYLKEINFKIINFCKKYNFFDHKDDLTGEAYICFQKCKEKFKGDKEDDEELEIIGKVRSDNILDKFEKFFYKLKEEEIWFIDLIRQGFNLKEVSEKLDISYEKIKDIWSEIKKKIDFKNKSRKEIRKEWKNRNPDYFKNWRKTKSLYMRKYMSLRRMIKNRNFLNVLNKFLLELCGCERVVLSEFKRSVDYINLKC
ncbi:MAG: hypothetical protein ABDH49_06320, partial [Candidatus Hydrothermales bacterium]